MSESPISLAAIAEGREVVARLYQRVKARAPEQVARRVEDALEAAEAIGEGSAVAARLEIAKALEDLSAELRGWPPFEAQFYRDGRLAVVRAQDPIKIKGAIDWARIELYFERYIARTNRAYARLEYFYERAGIKEEKKREIPPWEQPYVTFEQVHELLWGRVERRQREP